jgi:hypothetical protein
LGGVETSGLVQIFLEITLKHRFRDYLQDKIRGLDSTKVRIVLE